MDITVRRAKSDDLPRILDILNQDELKRARDPEVLCEDHYEAFRAIDADPNNAVFVALVGDEIVGTYQRTFMRHLMRRGCLTSQLESVHVAASWRRKGIGEAMMKHAIEEARARGSYRVQLTSTKSRADAHRFYERLGFQRSHEGMKLYL